MDADTKYLLKRMDELREGLCEKIECVRSDVGDMEKRLMDKIDPLTAFQIRVMAYAGLAGIVAGGLGSLAINMFVKHF